MQPPTNLIEDQNPKFNHIAEYFILKIVLFIFTPFITHFNHINLFNSISNLLMIVLESFLGSL